MSARLWLTLALVSLAGCSLARAPIFEGRDAGMDGPSTDVGDAPLMDVPVPDVPIDGFVPLDAPDVGLDAPSDAGVDAPRDGGVDAPIDPCSLCAATEACCDGVCVDITSDPAHCGSCAPCAAAPRATATCTARVCGLTCDADFADCNGAYGDGCEADLGSLTTCNACGTMCLDYPNTVESCAGSGCVYACSGTFASCDAGAPDCETDTSSSPLHCGACGRACSPTETCTAGVCRGWRPVTGTGAPRARTDHVAVWTGTEMIVWGGQTGGEELGDGAAYDPSTDTWRALSNTGAPSRRRAALAVWTGSRMIVWSGYERTAGWLNDGGIYDPATNTWAPIGGGMGAPDGRTRSTAVFTGTEMLFWSGWTGAGRSSTGAAFSVGSMPWDLLPDPGIAARRFHGAVWTGSRFVIWGGDSTVAKLSSGARYDRAADSWAAITGTGAPSARTQHAMVYVPSAARVVVWGGLGDVGLGDTGIASGGRYDPVANTWTATSASPLSGRLDTVAVATNDEMLVWGGRSDDSGGFATLGDGARYAPASDGWNALPAAGAPSARYGATAVWTGTAMIVFGGVGADGNVVGAGAALTL